MNSKKLGALFLMVLLANQAVFADASSKSAGSSSVPTLEKVVVKTNENTQSGEPFLPDVQGTQIYSGKKTTNLNLSKAPAVQPDQYRRVFSHLPGVLVSEVSTPSIVNFSYRGLNDPHESNGVLIMKDGIPVLSDWHGYPTLYYSPPLEAVERVEFIRGGSSLLYGPQPGPVLNYITYMPSAEKFSVDTKHTFGSDRFYSTFNSLGGTVGPVGYYGYYNYREGQGPRPNADFHAHSGNFKTVVDAWDSGRLILNYDEYHTESGEPGRLTFAQYSEDPNRSTTPDDRLWIDRQVASLTLEQEVTERGLLTMKPWVGRMDRFSRRQTGNQTNLDRQEFNFAGMDNRMKWLWDLFGKEQVLTGGFLFYFSDSPRNRHRGATRTSNDGPQVFEMNRSTQYWSVFLEQLFKVWRLSIIPAFRLEMISMNAEEESNTGVTRPLGDTSYFSAVPLFGLGFAFDLGWKNELYSNISQGYQPKEYDDLINPTSNTFFTPGSLEESRIWNYEVGLRGKPVTWFNYDTSLFFIDYDNYIETQNLGGGNSTRTNSGRAQFGGWEGAVETDFIAIWDEINDTNHGERFGQFGPFANIQLLNAKFVGGANDGRQPSYSPESVVKWGLTYKLRKIFSATLSSVFVSDHFWQDSNAAGAVGTAKVGEYKVWDLALESYLYKDILNVFGGVGNLFNERYYSRVRSDGIEPAAQRNFYGGFRVRIGYGQ